VAATEPIALVGFMAAGKTRAARAIAAELDEPVRDTDAMIADRLGEPLEDFFEREGEQRFREIEEAAVLEALDAGGVVALGGGAVGSERVRVALSEATTVWCRVSEEVAWERSKGTARPLVADRGRFGALYAERQPLYERVARVVLPRGGDETPARAASWIATLRARRGLRIAWARAGQAEYPVVVGAGAGELIGAAGAPRIGRRTFAVVDPRALAAGVPLPAGCEEPIEASGGERAKTLARAERVLVELARRGARRDDAVLALGGGVVGDLAGFCAAVYQRGIPVIQVPTTLLAQVDSALGGKTAVDLAEGKNYVGAYHQPAAVLSDPAALSSLPEEELAAGLAEVVKTALIAGGDLWDRVRALEHPTRSPSGLGSVIFECAQTKLAVIAEDERDGGRRAVLNLGHTIGHAIETASGYERYRHGEAVGLGLLAALRLSGVAELRAEVATLLGSFGLPTALDPELAGADVVAATARDKKATAAGLRFVMVHAPGDVRHGAAVSDADLLAAVEDLRA
jgi:shikimate kinase/3-dehydroquinate synthase